MAEAIESRVSRDPVRATSEADRVRPGTLAAYAVPVTGLALFVFYVQSFFLYFATDILLLPPAIIAAIFGVGRIWDAISDPLAGYWSDRTHTRIGRRRPWMFLALVPLAATFLMIWSPPAALQGGALIAWCTVALFGFYTAFTVYSVPHYSLGTELTTDHHERSKVFGAHSAMFTIGMLLSFSGAQYVMTSDTPRAAATEFSIGITIVGVALLLLTPSLVRERSEFQGRGGQSPYAALRDVSGNPHARLLFVVRFVESLGSGVLVVLSAYVSRYILKRPDMVAFIPLFFVGASIASIPLWVWLSRRFGKSNVWVVGLMMVAVFFGLTFFVGEGDVTLICVLLVFAGMGQGCGGVVGPSILADVIDYDEFQSGERKEGAYSAAWGFAFKLGMGSMIIIAGSALQLSGFVPNAEQTPTAMLVMKGMYAGIPFGVGLVGALLMTRFAFNEAAHAQVRATLESRNQGAGVGPDDAARPRLRATLKPREPGPAK
jgi:GPH family glycoside/pentoside/hexuronide:cation symporter